MSGFTFADLFAGVGGFHAALSALGGRCVYAAEIDDDARAVYREAWLADERADFPFTKDINDDVTRLDDVSSIAELVEKVKVDGSTLPHIPDFDVLSAGFPCQAFSKSGHQRGQLDATRGTLFYNILRIVAEKQPKIVFLENVRNLVGPRHVDTTFKTIIRALRDAGYVVSDKPMVISPHRVASDLGGGPQVRERVYIMAIRKDLVATGAESFGGFNFGSWDPSSWHIAETPLEDGVPAAITAKWLAQQTDEAQTVRLTANRGLEDRDLSVGDQAWLAPWRDLLAEVVKELPVGQVPFPGHPIWFRVADVKWCAGQLNEALTKEQPWKAEFVQKSMKFLDDYAAAIESVGAKQRILGLEHNSWMKLEWQAGDARSLDECLIQLRPSGIRIKKATYAPALVAINQTSILGSELRRLSPYEAGRLQWFPDEVWDAMSRVRDGKAKTLVGATGKSPEQWDRAFYKQFGNAVHVGAVRFALVQFMEHHFPEGVAADPSLAHLIARCAETPTWSEAQARREKSQQRESGAARSPASSSRRGVPERVR